MCCTTSCIRSRSSGCTTWSNRAKCTGSDSVKPNNVLHFSVTQSLSSRMFQSHRPRFAALVARFMRAFAFPQRVPRWLETAGRVSLREPDCRSTHSPSPRSFPDTEKLTKNGDLMTPQITKADCPSDSVIKKIALPLTMRARRCSPRRQTLIVASTKKMSRSNTLSWPIKVQGFVTADRRRDHLSSPPRKVSQTRDFPVVDVRG